jgi:lipopolysaccharide export system protein LptC
MHADSYSRWVSWLKVLFPLTALALLSTLFLISRAIDPETVIPFADKEIQDRLRNQQVTGPFFSGTTAAGDLISFSAETLKTPDGQTGSNRAEDVELVVSMLGGAKVNVTAQIAEFDIANDLAELSGDIVIMTSTQFRIVSDELSSQLSVLNLKSPGPVEATGPAGTLNAGSMLMTSSEDGNPAQLIFTNGVKLIYTPKQVEE